MFKIGFYKRVPDFNETRLLLYAKQSGFMISSEKSSDNLGEFSATWIEDFNTPVDFKLSSEELDKLNQIIFNSNHISNDIKEKLLSFLEPYDKIFKIKNGFLVNGKDIIRLSSISKMSIISETSINIVYDGIENFLYVEDSKKIRDSLLGTVYV